MAGQHSKPVLVIGDDMRIFLSVVRALGRAGKTVHALPFEPGAPALSSRYITRIAVAPGYEADPQGWQNALDRLLDTESFELVIPCGDPAIIALDRGRDRFSGQRLAIPAADAMQMFFDKEQTHGLCDDLGIPHVPWARLAPADTAESLIARFGLPLVLKPRRSFWGDTGRAREIVEIVDDRRHLEHCLATIPDRSRYLVEGYFEGSGTGVSVLSSNGTILQAFQHRRLREGRGGCSSYRISEAVNPGLRQAAERICFRTKHTGVCMFEIRVNRKTGKWVLIEINARFWGSLPLPLALGLDFPNRLHDLLVHGRSSDGEAYPAGIRSRNLLLDANNLLKRLRRDRLAGFGRWLADAAGFAAQPLRWLTGGEKIDSFAADDMVPALREIGSVLRRMTWVRNTEAEPKCSAPRRPMDGTEAVRNVSPRPLR